MKRPWHILSVIVFAQFAGTSLWFAGNALLPDLQAMTGWADSALGHLTTSVQLGFIVGTLVFASLSIPDRYPAPLVFLLSALAGAFFNLGVLIFPTEFSLLLLTRFATGFFLAGIYPVGMKIAADWYEKGLGRALGFLVGALVLGTAFPHLLRANGALFDWQSMAVATSVLAAAGGVLLFLTVPEGPFKHKGSGFELGAVFTIFRKKDFRCAAFGYFGHMWELYAFWAFVPVLLTAYHSMRGGLEQEPILSFVVIAVGGLGCVLGGLWAARVGSARVAAWALIISGMCGLLSPVFFFMPAWVMLVFLLIWGITVITDSPQLSTLVAQTAPASLKGSALTIVNSIGFAITIFSIQLLNVLQEVLPAQYLYLILVPGPILGVYFLKAALGWRRRWSFSKTV